jgi:hypothetical protein
MPIVCVYSDQQILLAMPIVCLYSDQQPGFRADPAQHQAEGADGGRRVRAYHRCGHQGHQGGSPQAMSSLSTLLARLLTPLTRLLTLLARLLTLLARLLTPLFRLLTPLASLLCSHFLPIGHPVSVVLGQTFG